MSKSKISIITHNHEAKLEVEYKTPSFEYLDKLQKPGGGNNFDLPLIKARKQMEKYIDKFDIVSLVMMSDGEWSYPANGV